MQRNNLKATKFFLFYFKKFLKLSSKYEYNSYVKQQFSDDQKCNKIFLDIKDSNKIEV